MDTPGMDALDRDGPGTDGAEPQPESAGEWAAMADGFQRLWTPHRMAYIQGDHKPPDPGEGRQCPFCRVSHGASDEESLVVARGTSAFVILNLFPYNPGHLLVCPYRHVPDYTDLDDEETMEIAAFTRTSMTVLRAVSAPHGFNLGMNQGAIAGAGIAAHLHQHVVPRWGGDANFLPVVGRTRALPQLLSDTWARVREAWPS